MVDLIDRHTAIESCMNHYEVGNKEQNSVIDWCVDMLTGLPSVDAVEVVRCKGCKHYRDYGCQRAFVYPKPDDFCSYGERADG